MLAIRSARPSCRAFRVWVPAHSSASACAYPNALFPPPVEYAFDVAVQRPHHTDARHHGRPVELDDQEQGVARGLPLMEQLLGLRQAGDVVAGIAQSQQLAPTR
jgi:hypothetical protein